MPIFFTVLIAGLVIFLDQVSKYCLKNADQVLLPGLIQLTGTKNTGVAFGALAGSSWLIMLLTALATGLLLFYMIKSRPRGLLAVGLSMILGGAAGNLIDRLFHQYVIDFIELLFVRFAIFNVADIAITVGWLLCLIALLLAKERKHA